jgi:multiple sugar transport system permease protein
MTISEDTPLALEPGAAGPRATHRVSGRRVGMPKPGRLVTYVALVAAVAITLLPFAWMLLGSFKSQGEILRDPTGFIPQNPTLSNYATWFGDLHIGTLFTTSLIVAVFTVLGNRSSAPWSATRLRSWTSRENDCCSYW